MKSTIKITNSKSGATTIDIEGTIGVPEEWQFENAAGRVATYEKFRRTLAAISKIRGGEVIVNIRSTGGDVGDALLIYDALAASGADISTRCYGYVASAATIIAQAASPGRREISANALYLVHNSVGSCEGNARDLGRNVELLAKTDERIAEIYALHSGRTADEMAALMAENNGSGRWLSPEETLAEGLADRIIEADTGTPGSPGTPAAPGAHAARKRNKPLATPSADADPVRWQQNMELDKLRRRIDTLEREKRQSAARPTELKPREDPAPTEGRRSANENAYRRDVENFLR